MVGIFYASKMSPNSKIVSQIIDTGSMLEIPLAVFDHLGALVGRTPSFNDEIGFAPTGLGDLLLPMVDDPSTRAELEAQLLALDPAERLAFRLSTIRNGAQAACEVHASSLTDGGSRLLLLRLEPMAVESMLFARIESLERQAMIGQVAAGVAHEFNNILTAMLGWAQIAARTVGGNEQATAALGTIEANTKRARQIASELLDLARPNRPERTVVRVGHVAEEALRLLAWELNSAHIQVTRDLEGSGSCECDPTRLLQVFVNIVRNALEATPAGGSLAVVVDRQGDSVRASFTDTGNGIPEAAVERIFEPFFTTKLRGPGSSTGGSGLGLAICRRIVEDHGGTIAVSSRRPGGTTMTVSLPAVEAAREEGGPECETRSSFPPGVAVLVVDDEPDIGEMIRTALTLRGAFVAVATGGEEALELCAARRFDAAFVDFSMAGLSGHALGHALAKVQPTLPIVFMSGVEIPEGGTPNISDFLKKPFDLHEIQCKLREVLDSTSQG